MLGVRTKPTRSLRAGACVLGAALVVSCRGEAPAPPPEPGAAPSPSLRPLTSRDRSAPAGSGSPEIAASLPPGHPAIDAAPPAAAMGAETAAVSGTITIAASLQARASGGVLFVIARSGPDRKIVAVRREEGMTFPFKFRISGADAMTAGTTFAGPLEVTARLSKSGDAVAAKGDLEGVARGIAVGAKDVKITLDTVHE